MELDNGLGRCVWDQTIERIYGEEKSEMKRVLEFFNCLFKVLKTEMYFSVNLHSFIHLLNPFCRSRGHGAGRRQSTAWTGRQSDT